MPTAKLTPALIKKVCRLIADGNYRSVAARAVRVTPEHFCRWLAIGRKAQDDSLHAQLYQEVLEAEQAAEIKMVKLVVGGARQDPKHAEWYLERKHPQRWGKDRLQIKELNKRVTELEKQLNAVPPPPDS